MADSELVRAMLGDLWWLRTAKPVAGYLRRIAAETRREHPDWSEPPVIVLQNGKVGSISVVSAISSSGRRKVVHLHHATERAVSWMRDAADRGLPLQALPGRSPGALEWAAQRIARVRYARHLLSNGSRGGLSVIVVVRDPIARSLSMCFHSHRTKIVGVAEDEALRLLIGSYEANFWLWTDASPWEAPAFLGNAYFDGSQPSWYSRELTPALGIDLIVSGLDMRRGFVITSVGPINVMILKTERLDEVLPSAARSFFGMDIAAVPHENTGGGRLYERFTREVSIPGERLDRILESRSNSALFSEEERDALRKRWAV